MASYKYATISIDENFIQKAFAFSIVIHSLFIMLKFEATTPKKELRDDAIKVELVSMKLPVPVVQKMAPVAPSPVVKTPEKKAEVKKVVQKKIDAGTLKKVANSKVLGDKTAPKVVENVQKGDPASKIATAYKPGTEVRKMPSANIGTGGNGNTKQLTAAGGNGDTYKGPDFAVKSLTSSTLGHRMAVTKIDDGGAGAGKGGGVGDGFGLGAGDGTITGSPNGTITKAKIATNMGSLTGSTVGVIGTSKGAEGLSTKGTVAIASVPDESVVLGGMDPNIIRQRLLEHLAQFRYCYQSELERVNNNKLNGLMKLNFDIGSSGNVQRVDVTGATSLNSEVKNCVAGVLRGISFPEPKGGGIVEVKQPMNFYSKYN